MNGEGISDIFSFEKEITDGYNFEKEYFDEYEAHCFSGADKFTVFMMR